MRKIKKCNLLDPQIHQGYAGTDDGAENPGAIAGQPPRDDGAPVEPPIEPPRLDGANLPEVPDFSQAGLWEAERESEAAGLLSFQETRQGAEGRRQEQLKLKKNYSFSCLKT